MATALLSVHSAGVRRDGDELHRIAGFEAHEHVAFSFDARFVHRDVHFVGRSHRLAVNFQYDVAGLEAAIGGRSVGIDTDDHDPTFTGARDPGRRYQLEAERR